MRMSSRLPESYAQITLTGNRFYQLCVNLDTGELILLYTYGIIPCMAESILIPPIATPMAPTSMHITRKRLFIVTYAPACSI